VFDHVTVRVSDRAESERFYDTVLGELGLERHGQEPWLEWGDFSVSDVDGEHPLTERLHIGFHADSTDAVDAFWRAGTGAGFRDDGAPGPRPQYTPGYYGAFLLDPDGNSVEAVIHEEPRPAGAVDHLWIGVSDLDASRRFYETLAPWTGFGLYGEHEFGVGFDGAGASFSLIPREPTAHAHIAFPATENDTVEGFHRAALEAGYRDNGPPGERPIYHAGYYGAFVLDPDGNNVEVVNHNR
jgi:catechol 2,3-dioxygenase-like lactoylglutathione lyase family enzyme